MYQPGLKVKGALAEVARHGYVLPAIQREFVWKPEQVCRFFDSMIQGYPIQACPQLARRASAAQPEERARPPVAAPPVPNG